jgi:ABC-type antimicrobial peptide transport system permease subunit
MELLAGRNFRLSDTLSELVINETYARELGFTKPEDALNGTIEVNDQFLPIVGVVKDFTTRSLHNAIEPVALGSSNHYGMVTLKLDASQGSLSAMDDLLQKLENKWKEYFTNSEFGYAFYDETLAKFYESERKTAKLLKVATAMALIISCLGLLGLATFMAERRRKEIGIRKVLGATVSGIVLLLSQDFVKLIAFALIIATPITWYFVNDWLGDYVYHINISWWIFLVAGIMALLIALLTVGFQSLKAAIVNPVESLRND